MQAAESSAAGAGAGGGAPEGEMRSSAAGAGAPEEEMRPARSSAAGAGAGDGAPEGEIRSSAAGAGAPEEEMRPAGSAAGAGAGGGAGGRGPNDEAWREEFAVAWGQTNAERGALRSQYAAVRDEIRELKDDPALDKFDAAMDRVEMLHDKVQRPLEQLKDGEALLGLTDVLVSSIKAENRDGPTPAEFVTALLKKFGAKATPLDDSNESFSWSSLGSATSSLFMTAKGCQTMIGPMGRTNKERRRVVKNQSRRLGSRPADVEPELAPDHERNDTDKIIDVIFDLLREHKRVKLENLVLNRQSFGQTAENIFALSFLVKEGRVEIDVVDDRDHFVVPRNAPEAKLIASREVTNSQFVLRYDMGDWEMMKRMVKPGEELMPHRGEYKNTQSCPAVSKLGSDSEQMEEDELAKEDPVEFTNDEAMKENLGSWCPGDDTLKKRKRPHVARALSFPDD